MSQETDILKVTRETLQARKVWEDALQGYLKASARLGLHCCPECLVPRKWAEDAWPANSAGCDRRGCDRHLRRDHPAWTQFLERLKSRDLDLDRWISCLHCGEG